MDKPPCNNPCKDAFGYCQGFKGKNADLKKILFVLHQPDSRVTQASLFGNDYRDVLFKSQTGMIITEILKQSNLKEDDIYITNLFKCLLPNDRFPTKEEYENCTSVLEQQIEAFKPRKMVLFGEIAYTCVFLEFSKNHPHKNTRGSTLPYKSTTEALISYHPGMIWKFPHEKRKPCYKTIADFLGG